jgi:hypothetical protein
LGVAPDQTYSAVDMDFIGGRDLNDKISSFIVSKTDDEVAGELCLFAYEGFRGPYLRYEINVPSIGINHLDVWRFNDVTSSAMLVRRYSDETAFALGADLGLGAQIDNMLSSGPSSIETMSGGLASLRGNTHFTWDMWPRGGYDNTGRWHNPGINKEYIVIVVPLTIHPPRIWDYQAEMWFWIYLYIDSGGSLRGFVDGWAHWNEESFAGGDIRAALHNFMINNDLATPINIQLNNWLTTISAFGPYAKVYYLPGDGHRALGNTLDDVQVVLVK